MKSTTSSFWWARPACTKGGIACKGSALAPNRRMFHTGSMPRSWRTRSSRARIYFDTRPGWSTRLGTALELMASESTMLCMFMSVFRYHGSRREISTSQTRAMASDPMASNAANHNGHWRRPESRPEAPAEERGRISFMVI